MLQIVFFQPVVKSQLRRPTVLAVDCVGIVPNGSRGDRVSINNDTSLPACIPAYVTASLRDSADSFTTILHRSRHRGRANRAQ